jgi:polygalacturonase
MSIFALQPTRRALITAAGAATASVAVAGAQVPRRDGDDPWAMAATIRSRIRPPSFPPSNRFTPRQFGGVADGQTLATVPIARAVRAASRAPGGGTVVLDGGVWLTGPIHLHSNVELHVAGDTIVRFATDPAMYFPPVLTRMEGNEVMGISPFIYAYGAENIAITGSGVLDGQAGPDHWWPWARRRPGDGESSGARLRRLAEEGVPLAQRVFGPDATIRPQFIQPYRCRNVLIEGITILRSPMWEIHPVECSNVTIRRVTISSHGPNNDGCDPESCRDVLIENCLFDTGDDCIAIKSGRNADGRRLQVPSENIIVADCTMADGHGGVTLGSEITGGVRNVFVERCRMDSPHLNTALRFKNNAARGGRLENIHVRDVTVGQVARAAITIDYNYGEGMRGDFVPVFDTLTVERLLVGRCQRVLDLQGFATAPIRNIVLRDSAVIRAAEPDIVAQVEGLRYDNVRRNGDAVTGPTQGGIPKAAEISG